MKVELSLKGERFARRMRTKDGNIPLVTGDRIAISTPGGGGRGEPAARSPALIEDDLRKGFITAEFAKQSYSHSG